MTDNLKRKSSRILLGALILSLLLHLLAYGSLLTWLDRAGPPSQTGEGESSEVFIQIGLITAPPVAPPAPPEPEPELEPEPDLELEPEPEPEPEPESEPESEALAVAESEIEIIAPLPTDQEQPEDPPEPEPSVEQEPLPPEEPPELQLEGRAGRDSLSSSAGSDAYLDRVRRLIEEATYYPRRARLSRLEGTVRVGFSIGSEGEVREGKLLESSPHQLFNRAGLDILQRAAPFPPPVPEIEGRQISVSISFESSY